MAEYTVRVGSQQHSVALRENPAYNLDVNYQIPTKSTQYTNLILDDISGGFNGVEDQFSLSVDGSPYTPIDEQQLLISINDVVLKPNTDYIVSNDQIVFTTPPTAGQRFSGVALVTTADLTRTLNFVIDAGSFPMAIGPKGDMAIDVTGTIESWILVADIAGNIEIDILKCAYDDYPNFTSITGTETPKLGILNTSTEIKAKDDNLSTWNTTVNAGDIFRFNVNHVLNISKASVALRIKL
tara:strand:+ start:13243 stop:13962 length:720 start_codon:yes stop_codon:yes gene_type:complete